MKHKILKGLVTRPVNGSDPDRVDPDPNPIPIYPDRIKNRIRSRSTQIRSMTRHGSDFRIGFRVDPKLFLHNLTLFFQ
ncbi:hypothetical protein AXF42_Ash006746 [Apostasia shenzhenica]|uniref:Uncharacterized protein n=1 Tax=Apostasia shenzhenica TaxID=1088818 RepID=A0A2I0AIZ9_9ASPA|nr:hypothetical protein AXF42_Ash006746 [Apostasia shenzhenica]